MILIIANARIKGGLSGGDNIYLHLAKECGAEIRTLMDIDFKPFFLCYVTKIVVGCWKALWDFNKYEFVYSASDFWMDSLPALIHKAKGNKWAAGFYMFAPKKNKIYYYSQKPIKLLIDKYADVVCVTNETLFKFKKPCIAVHGGVDIKHIKSIDNENVFDAVFVGRLHYTKGIDQLMTIWDGLLEIIPTAKLAIVGDGDSEAVKLKSWAKKTKGVSFFGFMYEDRFDIYKQSKVVLYTTPREFSHFSMAPIEAMACGCPMIAFNIPEMQSIKFGKGVFLAADVSGFIDYLEQLIRNYHSILQVRMDARDYARTWDWSVRSKDVIKQIRSYL